MAPQVKDPALSMQWFGSLLRHRFSPWPGELPYARAINKNPKPLNPQNTAHTTQHQNRNSLVAPWVKNLALSLLWLGSLLWNGFDAWPGNYLHAMGVAKKKRQFL